LIELSSQAIVLPHCFRLIPFDARIVAQAAIPRGFPPAASQFAANRAGGAHGRTAKNGVEQFAEVTALSPLSP
jgi:hypothetical protein